MAAAFARNSGRICGERPAGEGVAGEEGGEFGAVLRQRPRREDASVGEDDLEGQHVVLGAAVGDGPGAGGVGADHAAQAAVVLAGGVGGEEGPVLGGLLVEEAITSPGCTRAQEPSGAISSTRFM